MAVALVGVMATAGYRELEVGKVISFHNALGLFIVLAGLALWFGRRHLTNWELSRRFRIVLLVGASALTLAAADLGTHHYLEHRYLTSDTAQSETFDDSLYQWAQPMGDTRIGYAGGFLGVYPLLGAELSNVVTPVGQDEPHGGLLEATTCAAWREALMNAHDRYVLLAPYSPALPVPSAEMDWTRSIPGSHVAFHDGSASVFSLPRSITSVSCDSGPVREARLTETGDAGVVP